MEKSVYIEEALKDVLKETDLVNFERKLCVELQLLRLEHFDHVTDEELKSYTGLSQPAIRRLRVAIAEKKKKTKKPKGIFSTIGKKESREITKILVPATNTANLLLSIPEKGSTCLIIKEQIKLMERLGEGSFAVVKRGIWTPKTGRKLDVAVKILRDSTPEIIEDLQCEVTNMQKLQHPNLIQLYGIVFSNPAMMVVEFCDGGALVDRLRSTEKPVVLVSMLVDYAQQIAKGMAYLESKHCVHRDLAARNVLLTANDQVAKICDFGLMRVLEDNQRLYVMSAQKKVPFAWCPPESLRYRQFSHASDVWSFGVTLWELFSYGEEPWVALRGAEVLTRLEAGERLARPQRCSDELYDLISTCWSLEPDSRPKFSLLKGILSEIMFMIAECREPSTSSNDVNLEMAVNDRVIVIHGSGSIWYGQNMRTRKFGSFYRRSVHSRSERCPAKAGEQLLSPMRQRNGDDTISRPVPGSFIHAGHGDVNPEQSWGQPDHIDDIYLKNPILRKEGFADENNQKRFGPEIIPSLIDLQPPLYRWKREQSDTTNDGTDPCIDPFAPFSVYSFDAVSDSGSYRPGGGTTKLFSSSLVSNFYDQPPLHSLYSQDITQLPTSDSFVPDASTSGSNISNNTWNGIAFIGGGTHPQFVQETNKTNSQQFSSLPRPVRLVPDIPSCSQLQRTSFSGVGVTEPSSPQSLTTTQSASASQLLSASWDPLQLAVQNKSDASRINANVHRASSFREASSIWEHQVAIDGKNAMQNGKIPPPRPKPPNFNKKGENNTQRNSPFVLPDNIPPAYPSSGAPTQATSSASRIPVSSTSNPQDSTDPFEVSKAVKDIANRGRYSQLFKDLSVPDKASACSSDTTKQMTLKQPCGTEISRPSSILLSDRLPSTSQPSLPMGLTKYPPETGTCYYWQPGHAKLSEQSTFPSSYGSTPALLYDAQLGVSSEWDKPVSNGISLRPRRANNHPVGSSTRHRNSYLSDEILGMFDPLIAERDVVQEPSNVATSSTQNSDPVSTVLKNAAFADRERCAIKLQCCNNNIEKAVNELKIEELLSLGVAQDRGQAINALRDCRWNLNAAAAALIS